MIVAKNIRLFNSHSILIDWEASIDPLTNRSVLCVEAFINEQFSEVIVETVPSYHALAIYLKPNVSGIAVISAIKKTLMHADIGGDNSTKRITIPVCYDVSLAPDIEQVSAHCKLTIEGLIQLHSSPVYKTYFLGFLPGFPYLGGLDSKLEAPRLRAPRETVLKGSVAIGGKQTGIYPSTSPGGWNIIGCTPISLFDLDAANISLLQPGDSVQFKPITKKQFATISREVENGSYQIEMEEYHD